MSINIGAPQALIIFFYAFSIIRSAVNHGKPEGEYNAYATVICSFIGIALLAWGGFFS